MGRQTSNPQFQNPTSWDPELNYSKTMGRHSIKVGYQFLLVHTEILDTNPLYGQDTYSGAFSKPTCAQLGQPTTCTVTSDTTSYSLADFMFGLPSQVNLGSYTVVNLRQYVHSLYFQDDYRVSSKLTLNVGLRWEFASPDYERDNNYSNFNPATNSMIQATSGSLFNRSLVHPDYQRFWARGLAWLTASIQKPWFAAAMESAIPSSIGREARRRESMHLRPFSASSASPFLARPHLPHHAEQL